jgi:predicted lipid-binding transport protein (Tim44 family)
MPLTIAISSADARPGGKGGSMGSRGSKTFQAPPSTATAPNAAQPMNRTMQQPGSPGMAGPAAAGAASKGGFFNRPGMGMLGGLAAGFLGAGLLGMLFGGGFLSGLGSMMSIIGLLVQVALIVIVVRLAMKWWQRRNQGQNAYAGPAGSQFNGAASGPDANQNNAQANHAYGAQPQQGYEAPQSAPRSALGGFGFGASRQDERPVEIQPKDYEDFERLLTEVQAAWSKEDTDALGKLATPEMTSYFAKDLAENKANNDINTVSDVKLLQGDLAEAWREGNVEYASVAMRFSLVDKTLERGTNRLVAGSETPTEATEVWTFLRENGGKWELSAIQQA